MEIDACDEFILPGPRFRLSAAEPLKFILVNVGTRFVFRRELPPDIRQVDVDLDDPAGRGNIAALIHAGRGAVLGKTLAETPVCICTDAYQMRLEPLPGPGTWRWDHLVDDQPCHAR